MRRRKDTPNGLMEFLITEAVAWAREHNVTEVSLNFSVFADFLRADEDAACSLAAPLGVLKADRLFQLDACTASTASSSRTGGAGTSASSAGAISRSPGSPTCTPSRSCPPGPWVKSADLAAH